jgi:hypothetical protein
MNFYNRRIVALADRRWATGYQGKRNAGWRELYDGFVPDRRLRKQISRGLRRWLKCELINLALMLQRPVIRTDQRPAGIHAQLSPQLLPLVLALPRSHNSVRLRPVQVARCESRLTR